MILDLSKFDDVAAELALLHSELDGELAMPLHVVAERDVRQSQIRALVGAVDILLQLTRDKLAELGSAD